MESRPLRVFDAPFFVAMLLGSLLVDTGHLNAGQPLTVALPLMVPGLALELVDTDLRTLGLLNDLPGNRHLRQRVGARSDVVAIDYESCGEGVLGSRLAVELLDLNDVADGHLVLLAAGLHDGVRRHGSLLLTRQCLRGSRDQHPAERGSRENHPPQWRADPQITRSAPNGSNRGPVHHSEPPSDRNRALRSFP